MLGRVIGSYRLDEKIGEGGMGAVYRAVDLVLERDVAIKAIRPELARETEVAERFRAEAKLLARINHPAIATIYTFLEEGDEFFLVMEFVRGRSFARLLEDEIRIPWRRAVELIGAALSGIEHAHQLGIVHRDLKPENLMLTDAGLVKVMDFGVARVIGTTRQTRTGLLVGSLHYMAPEQIRAEEVDNRTDLYALGVVLYEMLTGRLPFVGPSDYAVLRAQVEADPEPPSQLTGGLPIWLERAVLTALAKEPAQRFPSATAMRQALLGDEATPTPSPRTAFADLPTLVRPIPQRPPSAPDRPNTPAANTLPAVALSQPTLPAVTEPKHVNVATPVASPRPLPQQGSSYRIVPPFKSGTSRNVQALWLVVAAVIALAFFLQWKHRSAPTIASTPVSASAPLPAPPASTGSSPSPAPIESTPVEKPQPTEPPATIGLKTPPADAAQKVTAGERASNDASASDDTMPESNPPNAPATAWAIAHGSSELADRYRQAIAPPRHTAAPEETALADGLAAFQSAAQHVAGLYEQGGFFSRARRTLGRIAHNEDESTQLRRSVKTMVDKGGDVDRLLSAAHPAFPVRRAWQRIRRQVQRIDELLR